MESFRNKVKSLFYTPFESLVGLAEYIYTLHSKKSHRILFFVVLILSSVLFPFVLSGSMQSSDLSKHFTKGFSLSNIFSWKTSTTSNVVYDPLLLLEDIRQNRDVLIVDLRSKEDFKLGHIRYAVNVPVTNASKKYPSEELIKIAIQEIKEKATKKSVVVYGHFQGSTYAHEVVESLRKQRVNASLLAIGWNEWYHFRNLWLPESQWSSIDMDVYVQVDE